MYLFRKLIFAVYNLKSSIYVYENKWYRWLCFDNDYIQTIISKKKPYKPVLKYLPALCLNLNLQSKKTSPKTKVVMLGSGGGAIAHYINKYHKKSQLIMIEHNSIIIDIAQRYFGINKEKIIKADAFEYIKQENIIDDLLIDIFINQNIPSLICNTKFLMQCQLKATNCVSFNLVSKNTNEVLNAVALINKVFNKQTLIIPIKNKSNLIIHAYTNNNYLNTIKQLTLDKIITKPQWQQKYGLVSILK